MLDDESCCLRLNSEHSPPLSSCQSWWNITQTVTQLPADNCIDGTHLPSHCGRIGGMRGWKRTDISFKLRMPLAFTKWRMNKLWDPRICPVWSPRLPWGGHRERRGEWSPPAATRWRTAASRRARCLRPACWCRLETSLRGTTPVNGEDGTWRVLVTRPVLHDLLEDSTRTIRPYLETFKCQPLQSIFLNFSVKCKIENQISLKAFLRLSSVLISSLILVKFLRVSENCFPYIMNGETFEGKKLRQ